MINNWNHYLWENDQPLDKDAVSFFEKEKGIKYPSEYLQVLSSHQGKTPEPESILVTNKVNTAISCFLHFSNDEYENSYNVRKVISTLGEDLPSGIIPFADSSGGDYFCFDFREAAPDPKIVFFSHEFSGEDALFPLAGNFNEFLNKIK